MLGNPPQEGPTTTTEGGGTTGLRSVREIHVDFLLEEEFAANPEFAGNFVHACPIDPPHGPCQVQNVTRSWVCKHGEIDLRVDLSFALPGEGQCHLVLLIENKINAAFQPDQPERYSLAAQDEEQESGRRAFALLVAPAAYITKGHKFPSAVTYEDMRTWFCPDNKRRQDAKTAIIDNAIEKSGATGVQVVDTAMTDFRKAYYSYLEEYNRRHGTDFAMRPPAPTYAGDTWFILKSKSLPDWIRFRHMAPTGYVEVSFANAPLGPIETFLRQIAPTDFTVTKTGKYGQHATVRRPIKPIGDFDSFETVRPIVAEAFRHFETLLWLVRHNRARLEAALVPAQKGGGEAH